MADPLSIAAIVGLIFAAKKCSKDESEPQSTETFNEIYSEQDTHQEISDNRTAIMNTFTGTVSNDPGLSGTGVIPQEKQVQPSFGDVAFMKHVNGEPVRDFRNRPYVSGKMNNFGPVEKQLVGSGLGVGPDVPAYGGYQQLFRVNPNNVNAYRLTTLPGRSGPAADVTGGRQQQIGTVTHNMPEKTAFLPSRRPDVKGRAQGQGGALTGVTVRGEYEKTKRTTNRSETTLRQDGLGFAPAKKFISAGTLAEDPTRNKGDLNIAEYQHVNNPAPGISNFKGGYTNNPEVQYMNNNGNLQDYGIRETTRRGKNNREGNAGRMNVRADPLNQGGMITAVRSDCSRIDGRTGPANGASQGRMQNYMNDLYHQFNAYKGNYNPRTSNSQLNTARNQLSSNPFAHTLAA